MWQILPFLAILKIFRNLVKFQGDFEGKFGPLAIFFFLQIFHFLTILVNFGQIWRFWQIYAFLTILTHLAVFHKLI